MKLVHKHHVVPKHMGGTDDPSNIVTLTIEQHANAHRLLYEQHEKWEDKLAWLALSGQIGKEEIIRTKLSEAGRKSSNKGYKPTALHKQRQSIAKLGKPHYKIRGSSHGRANPIWCDGIRYGSVTEAAIANGVTPHTIRNRLASGKWDYRR